MWTGMNVMDVYHELLATYGLQHWWPVSKTDNAHWHDQTFEIIIGTILTQNTTWTNVEKALTNLIEAEALSIESISDLDEDTLKTLIRPAGYFNQKTKKLLITTEFIKTYFDGNAQAFAEHISREELLAIWGIGPETADSILLYAGNRPEFVIDTYTKRLCKARGVEFGTYDEYKNFFTSNLDQDAQLYNEYHALIVRWGKSATKARREP